MVHSSEYRKLSVSYSPSSKGSAQSSLEAIIEQQETLPLIAATQEADEYRKKLQQKSLFVRSASHEIRTHLNVVLAALLWLELESVKQPKIFHDTIQLTKDACTSAVDIQNDLLAYEKLDENILTVESSPILIAILVEGMIKPFSIQARQKQIRIMLEETEGMRDIFVSADEYKLAQVLRNLLANAVKFTLPNGTITVKVTRIVKESKEEGLKDWIRLEVIDDGFGLTKVVTTFQYTSLYYITSSFSHTRRIRTSSLERSFNLQPRSSSKEEDLD